MLVCRFGFSWRAVSLGEAAVVLFCFGCRLPVSFLPLCVLVYMERCAVGPRPQGLLERPGEDFCLRSRRRVAVGGVGDGETGSVSLYKGNLNKLSVLFFRPPPHGATTTHWRESIPSPLDSSRRLEHSTYKKFVFRVSGCRVTRRVRIFARIFARVTAAPHDVKQQPLLPHLRAR
jgi:hypothetical protein